MPAWAVVAFFCTFASKRAQLIFFAFAAQSYSPAEQMQTSRAGGTTGSGWQPISCNSNSRRASALRCVCKEHHQQQLHTTCHLLGWARNALLQVGLQLPG
jgi:hypothetical protein